MRDGPIVVARTRSYVFNASELHDALEEAAAFIKGRRHDNFVEPWDVTAMPTSEDRWLVTVTYFDSYEECR